MNQLGKSINPYLRQHIKNPIDWREWDSDILIQAQTENKPLFISIGYSTCHWCHVMAKEAFSDLEVAKYLNQLFIAVKVDREEHPEVDAYYMNAAHLMGVSGGWPLSVFADKNGIPFFIGTYYPVNSNPLRGGTGFLDLIQSIYHYWTEKKADVEIVTSKISFSLEKHFSNKKEMKLFEPEELEVFGEDKVFFEVHHKYFDKHYGGFKFQPHNKFPSLMNLSHLLKIYQREKKQDCLSMVETSVRYMMTGGIYDQLGGGLCRYSTDYEWRVPHFEKMLYDNALLLDLLGELFLLVKKEEYKVWAYQIVEYYEMEMKDKQGGFFSAEDADSEGEEGKFYFWSKEEVEHLIRESDKRIIKESVEVALEVLNKIWGINSWQGTENVLYQAVEVSLKEIATELDLEVNQVEEIIAEARQVLFEERSKRIRPFKDVKVITTWNGVMLKSYAKLARIFSDRRLLKQAHKGLDFFYQHYKINGRFMRYVVDGVASKTLGGLSDYGALIVASLAYYQATLDKKWLNWGKDLMRLVIDEFGTKPLMEKDGVQSDELKENEIDQEYSAGFSEISESHGFLIEQVVDAYDGVEPSGNSLVSEALVLLDIFFPEDGYGKRAENLFCYFRKSLSGTSLPYMLSVFHNFKLGFTRVEVVGSSKSVEVKKWIKEILSWSRLDLIVKLKETKIEQSKLKDGKVFAIVCRGEACSQPFKNFSELEQYLK